MSPMSNAPESPFGPSLDRRRWIIRGSVIAGLIIVALGGTMLVTRGDAKQPTAQADEHAGHGVVPAGSDSAKSVLLTASEAERIGVTYATVEAGFVASTIRTVGQVTFDEARVKTISPKIDGFVEQLYVNSTGQYVGRGQPLFTIYSPMLVATQDELLLAKRLASDVSAGSDEAKRYADGLVAAARRRLQYWDVSPAEIAADRAHRRREANPHAALASERLRDREGRLRRTARHGRRRDLQGCGPERRLGRGRGVRARPARDQPGAAGERAVRGAAG